MKPSAYLLVLRNPGPARRTVGRLGILRFEPGYYVYVGSGGPNVLKRVRRHIRPRKPLRWHIDYLTAGPRRMRVVDIYLYPDRSECELAGRLRSSLDCIAGFGSSDCRCPGHLLLARTLSELGAALARVGSAG